MRQKSVIVATAAILLFGGVLAVAATAVKTGILKVDSPGLVLKFRLEKPKSKGAKAKETPVPPEKEVPFPVGSHTPSSLTLCAQDDKRQTWSLESAGGFGQLQTITVSEGQTTTVQGGAPLKIQTTVTVTEEKSPKSKSKKDASEPKQYIVNVVLRYLGKAGENYSPRVMIGNRRADPPTIRLLTYEGKVLAEGPYKFGSSGTGGG